MEELIQETVEKHDTLNPKLFNDDETLKKEVRDKMLEIVDVFAESLEKDGIKFNVDDIILIGSNANYNYTKNSDIDLHIITNTDDLHCPDDLYPLLYSAYRSLFNKKFDISFYGIPLEIYVETSGTPRVSGGVYSVKDNKWLKKPIATDIPDIDTEAVNKEVNKWKKRYNTIIKKYKADLLTEDEIEEFINRLYALRKDNLSASGEFGTPNLVFKEMRNLGCLDKLKDIKSRLKAQRLSLESLYESENPEYLDSRTLDELRIKLSRLTKYPGSIIVQPNGYFKIYNVKQNDVNTIISTLRNISAIKNVSNIAGRFDFSNPINVAMKGMPDRVYTISGQITEKF